MYIANDYYFESDTTSLFPFGVFENIFLVRVVLQHSMDLVRCIDGLPRFERLRAFGVCYTMMNLRILSQLAVFHGVLWC